MSNKFTQEWEADIRVGVVAVHVKDNDRFKCLDGRRDECIFWRMGEEVKNPNGEFARWKVNPVDVANAHLIAASPCMYQALRTICEAFTNGEFDRAMRVAGTLGQQALAKAGGK